MAVPGGLGSFGLLVVFTQRVMTDPALDGKMPPTCMMVFVASMGISAIRNVAADAEATRVLRPTFRCAVDS